MATKGFIVNWVLHWIGSLKGELDPRTGARDKTFEDNASHGQETELAHPSSRSMPIIGIQVFQHIYLGFYMHYS